MVKTLTQWEIKKLLYLCSKRDRMLIAFALATGLRCHEVLSLNIEDILTQVNEVRYCIVLRVFKGHQRSKKPQFIFLSRRIRKALGKWLAHERRTSGPLFTSRQGNRLSLRQVRTLFRRQQQRAGFDRIFGFHALSHTACTRVYAATKDIRLTQRFARHVSILTTMMYTHPTDDDLMHAVNRYC